MARTVLDITAMAKALGKSEKEVLEELLMDTPSDMVQTWVTLAKKNRPGTLDRVQDHLALASHFVERI